MVIDPKENDNEEKYKITLWNVKYNMYKIYKNGRIMALVL